MTTLGKALYVLSSFSPVFLFWGIKLYLLADDNAIYAKNAIATSLALLAVSLAAIAWFLLLVPIDNQPSDTKIFTKIKYADKDLIAFIVAYLSPLIKRSIDTNELILASVISCAILIFMIRSNSPLYNPVFACFGYKFYEVECDAITYLYLSRKDLTDAPCDVLAKNPFLGMLIESNPLKTSANNGTSATKENPARAQEECRV